MQRQASPRSSGDPASPRRVPCPSSQHADQSLNQLSLEYPYDELEEATKDFDQKMQVGSGTYGGVFRGLLKDGTEVAVKVLELPDEAGFEEEVKVLSRFRHPNLVILMGFARNGCQRCLVYEMLSGGDVHKRLQRACGDVEPFPWAHRLSISADACCGLSHLHHSRPKVFHRDIKSANILLDRNGLAKMADFGLACLSHSEQHRVKQCSGTVGYACPLYVQRGVVTEGSEVYSFGMVLFELITSSPPAYLGGGGEGGKQEIRYLISHINGDVDKAMSLADPKASWPSDICHEVASLAVACTDMREERRPGFADIVRSLRSILQDSAAHESPAPSRAGSKGWAKDAVGQEMPLVQRSPLRQPRPAVILPSGLTRTPSDKVQAQQQQSPPQVAASGSLPRPVRRQCSPGSHVHGQSPGMSQRTPEFVPPPSSAGQRTPAVVLPPSAYPQRQPLRSRVRAGTLTPSTVLPTSGDVLSTSGPYSFPSSTPMPAVRLPAAQQPQHQHRQRDMQPWGRQVRTSMPTAALQSSLPARQEEPARQQSVGDQPTLFALECIYSEGFDLFDIQAEDRTLTHRMAPEERFQFPLPPLRVGRGFQASFFDTVVADGASRSTISREHFQIWAEEALDRGRPHSGHARVVIFIANLSGNGTRVNERCLLGRGEQCVLHDGDIITLSRDVPGPDGPSQAKFLQFHFDLSESCLREANVSELHEPLPTRTPRLSALEPVKPATPQRQLPPDEQQCLSVWIGEAEIRSRSATRDPAFVLKVEGPAVFEHVPDSERVLAFSPLPEEDPSQLYSSMVVGRAHQLEFWERVIDAHAFDTMSRQHFEIQTWRSDSVYSFLVRNLSDVNPIRIQVGTNAKEYEVSLAMARDEQRHLLDGDRIIMNWGQESVFWLTFSDYTRSTQLSLEDDEGPPFTH